MPGTFPRHLLLLHLGGLRRGHAGPLTLLLLARLALATPGILLLLLLLRSVSAPLLLAVGAVG